MHSNTNFKNVDSQCTNLCVKTKGVPSVLHSSREDKNNLTAFTWLQILNEMKDRAPDVIEFLSTIAEPNLKDDRRQVAPLSCLWYFDEPDVQGVIFHSND